MLKSLSIDNYALINRLSIEFGQGVNIITGETGAGKSILLGALGLILGQRADTRVLKDSTRKCIVEGVFAIEGYALDSFFQEHSLDYSSELIMRREISPQGKSRAFINDTPVALGQMKDLGDKLMDIHSQSSALLLSEISYQLAITDALAGNREALLQYRRIYRDWQAAEANVKELQERLARQKADEDYFRFLLDEFEQLNLKRGETAAAESEIEILRNAGAIKEDLFRVMDVLSENEQSVIQGVKTILPLLQKSGRFHSGLQSLAERLGSSLIEIQDIASELPDISDSIEIDPARLQEMESRLDRIYTLFSKHRVTDEEGLLEFYSSIGQKMQGITGLDEAYQNSKIESEQLFADLLKRAARLSEARKKSFSEIESGIPAFLGKMGMPDASLKVLWSAIEMPGESGSDRIRFLFSANKGIDPEDISRVASGGELSRLMLAFKSLISGKVHLPSLIFDEIDSGVSGDIAGKLAGVLKTLSIGMQLIVITHNPQVAALSGKHFRVYKEDAVGVAETRIADLNAVEREDELARMLSGENYSDAALLTARQLMER